MKIMKISDNCYNVIKNITITIDIGNSVGVKGLADTNFL